MAGRGNPKTGGRDFKPGQSGNPKGRATLPPELRALRRFTTDEYRRIVSALFYSTEATLIEWDGNPEAFWIERLIASILLKAKESGNMTQLDLLLTRLVGRPREASEDAGSEAKPVTPLTQEQRLELVRVARGEK